MKTILVLAAAATAIGLVAAPSAAQFSDSYNFLKAVKERKGEEVEKFLGRAGKR